MNPLSKISFWLTIIIAVAVFAAGTYLLIRLSPFFLSQLGISTNVSQPEEAPDFILEEIGADKVKLSDFRGKPIVLIFWTSWNEASIDGLKTLASYGAVEGARFTIFAINSLEGKNIAQEIEDRHKLGLRMLLDADGSAGEAYKIGVLPKIVFIDKGGLIVSESEGPLSIDYIQKWIAKLR